MLPVALFSAVALLLVQTSEAKDAKHIISARAALLEERVVSEKGDFTSSTHDNMYKERVHLHGLPKTVGYVLYNIIATPFEWMWDVVTLPFTLGKTMWFAWNIHKEGKADANSANPAR